MYVNQDPKRSIGQGQTMKYSFTSLQDFFQQESGMGLSPSLSPKLQSASFQLQYYYWKRISIHIH